MKYTKLIDFLYHDVKNLYVMNCSSAYIASDAFLDVIYTGLYSEVDIDLGIMYIKNDKRSDYLIVDGKTRILSLMLFLLAFDFHNEIFMKIVKKLKLFGYEKTIFEKIINKEPFLYNEKQTYVYKQYEYFKEKLESSNLDKDKVISILDRLTINIVDATNSNERDVFYWTNKHLRDINQAMLIKSYLAEFHQQEVMDKLMEVFNFDNNIIISFFKAYLSPKFDKMISDDNSIYEYFKMYFDTISKYQEVETVIKSILSSSTIYKKMYFAEFADVDIRNAFIRIITNNGKDTFSYLLELCEDYVNNYLPKETLLEICNIIITYTNERNNKASFSNANFNFSRMAQELNELIYKNKL